MKNESAIPNSQIHKYISNDKNYQQNAQLVLKFIPDESNFIEKVTKILK